MGKLEHEINLVLSGWNPIGVDGNVAQTEYISYVKRIIDSIDKGGLINCLENILLEMGLPYDRNDAQHFLDVENLSKLITKLYNENHD